MEKHKCKLCYRKFSNGRALGGHMRSHMMNLPLPPKHHPPPPPQLGCATESSTESPSFSQFSSSSSSESEHEDTHMKKNSPNQDKNEDEDNIYTESITEPTGSSSLVTLQDRESETESFKKNPTRRRSKRSSSTSIKSHQRYCNNYTPTNSVPEPVPVPVPESVSVSPSVSDVTSDTDLAYCLLMMSRDKWSNTISSGSNNKYKTSSVKRKYKCDTCNKVFRSYQALGGHRASHKKIRSNVSSSKNLLSSGAGQDGPVWNSGRNSSSFGPEVQEEEHERGKKVHECPVCFRVFSSGQALGGHKRSHGLLISGNNDDYVNGGNNHDYLALNDDDDDHDGSPKKMKMKMMMVINGSDDNDITNESLIDLNLPPSDYYGEDDNEEEISQIDDVHL